MLASRPQADPPRVDRIGAPAVQNRNQPYGLKRVAQAYAITLLAAVLGLPGLVAGLITSNNCTLHGTDCSARLVYGVVGGVALAALVQLILALHFRLGWPFWCYSVLLMAAAAAQLDVWPVLLLGVVFAPGLAAWVSDPPNRRAGILAHWLPRISVLVIVVATLALTGLLRL